MTDDDEKKTELDKSEHFFQILITRYPEVIKIATKLTPDEFEKLETDYLAKKDSKKRYLYDAAQRLQQAGFFYIRTKDFLKDAKNDEFSTPAGKNFAQAIERDISLWTRSLSELFVSTFLFRSTASEKYYRYYYLTRALMSFAARANNKKIFFGIEKLKENEIPINNIKTEMQSLEQSGERLEKCWFIRKDRGYDKHKSINDFKQKDYTELSASFRANFMRILPKLHPSQRIVMGLDYSSFAQLSEAIHNNIGSPRQRIENYTEHLDGLLTRIPLMAAHVELNILKAARIKPDELKDLEKVLIYGFDKKIYVFSKKKLSVSDYVLVNGMTLGRVIAVHNTPYGYQSITVEHIDSSGWRPQEDTFSSEKIMWLFDYSKVEKDFRNIVSAGGGHRVRISKTELNKLLDKSVNDLWHNAGAKEYMFGDMASAQKKIQELIQKRQHG